MFGDLTIKTTGKAVRCSRSIWIVY